jgi:CubicO group peptidase (beta-lactamase class C family)
MWHPDGGASAYVKVGSMAQVVGSSKSFAWASVSKVVTALACLIAVEEGSVALDDRVEIDGATGSAELGGPTLAHLLAHAGGIDPELPIQRRPPASRRVYSNASIRLAAHHVERRTGMAFENYVQAGIFDPLDMGTVSWSDPAAGSHGTIHDLCALAVELLSPTLISNKTLDDARRPWWPDLAGVVPGFGLQQPCPWGLGFEIKGSKSPHWTGTTNSPETFGHFGQSGSMLAVDPMRGEAWCSLSPAPFGPWARDAWPLFIDSHV